MAEDREAEGVGAGLVVPVALTVAALVRREQDALQHGIVRLVARRVDPVRHGHARRHRHTEAVAAGRDEVLDLARMRIGGMVHVGAAPAPSARYALHLADTHLGDTHRDLVVDAARCPLHVEREEDAVLAVMLAGEVLERHVEIDLLDGMVNRNALDHAGEGGLYGILESRADGTRRHDPPRSGLCADKLLVVHLQVGDAVELAGPVALVSGIEDVTEGKTRGLGQVAALLEVVERDDAAVAQHDVVEGVAVVVVTLLDPCGHHRTGLLRHRFHPVGGISERRHALGHEGQAFAAVALDTLHGQLTAVGGADHRRTVARREVGHLRAVPLQVVEHDPVARLLRNAVGDLTQRSVEQRAAQVAGYRERIAEDAVGDLAVLAAQTVIGIDRGHPGAVERSAGIVPRTVEAHVVHRREEFGSRQQHAGLTLGHRLLVVCRTVDVEPQVGAFADDLLHLRLGRIDQREVLLGRRALQTRQLHLGQLRDAVPLVDHRCEVHRLGGVTTHQHGVVRRDVAAAEVVAPETAARMQAFEGRNGILLEEFPHERRPAVVARRVGQHARSVRAVPVVKPLAHTRYEEVANPALGQDLGHLHRAARDIDVVGRPVVAAGQVLADPLAAVVGLAH